MSLIRAKATKKTPSQGSLPLTPSSYRSILGDYKQNYAPFEAPGLKADSEAGSKGHQSFSLPAQELSFASFKVQENKLQRPKE
jgi:hypothetical protein